MPDPIRESPESQPIGELVLGLLAGNLSSKEIAAKLRISPRTVDHHVFAILGKLGVPNRKDAASRHSQLACEI
jgi:DNA-binding NarL/FixJ family response regulator